VTVEEALVQFLVTVTDVDCYFLARPQGYDDLPAVVVEKMSEEREDAFDSRAVNIPYEFQIRVWTIDPATTLQLSTAIRDALDGFAGDMQGRNVCYASFTGEEDSAEPPFDDSNRWIYGRHSTYEIIVEDE